MTLNKVSVKIVDNFCSNKVIKFANIPPPPTTPTPKIKTKGLK